LGGFVTHEESILKSTIMALLLATTTSKGFYIALNTKLSFISNGEIVKRKQVFVVAVVPPDNYKEKNETFIRKTKSAALKLYTKKIEKHGFISGQSNSVS
jgi:hypothetical protein